MPTPTYTPLANLTLSTAQNSILFYGFAQSFRDLILIVYDVNDGSGANVPNLRIDSGTSGYSGINMQGNGSSVSSNQNLGQTDAFWMTVSSVSGNKTWILNIMDYSATDKHKTVLSRIDAPSSATNTAVGRYASTSAVTQLTLFHSTGNFAAGSTFALFGIAA